MDSISIPISLVGTVVTGMFAASATIYGIIASRRLSDAQASSELSGAWKETVSEMRIELKRLRERIDRSEEKYEDCKIKQSLFEESLSRNEEELNRTKFKLSLAEETIDIALDWMNDYTPLLRKAGIEPLNIDRLKFRGDNEPEGEV